MLIYRIGFAKFREKLTIRKIQFFTFHISTVDESDFNVAVDPDSPSICIILFFSTGSKTFFQDQTRCDDLIRSIARVCATMKCVSP